MSLTVTVFVDALARVLPLVLLFLVGIFLRRLRFLAPDTIQDLKKLVVNLTLQALLFLAFAGVELAPKYLLVVATVFAA